MIESEESALGQRIRLALSGSLESGLMFPEDAAAHLLTAPP